MHQVASEERTSSTWPRSPAQLLPRPISCGRVVPTRTYHPWRFAADALTTLAPLPGRSACRLN